MDRRLAYGNPVHLVDQEQVSFPMDRDTQVVFPVVVVPNLVAQDVVLFVPANVVLLPVDVDPFVVDRPASPVVKDRLVAIAVLAPNQDVVGVALFVPANVVQQPVDADPFVVDRPASPVVKDRLVAVVALVPNQHLMVAVGRVVAQPGVVPSTVFVVAPTVPVPVCVVAQLVATVVDAVYLPLADTDAWPPVVVAIVADVVFPFLHTVYALLPVPAATASA